MTNGVLLEPPVCDDRKIFDLWLSMLTLPTLTAADELGMLEALERCPASAPELANSLSLASGACAAVLTHLAAQGLLMCHDGRYRLTPVARTYLLPSSPFYWGGMLHPHRSEQVTHADVVSALIGKRTPRSPASGGPLPAEEWVAGAIDPNRAVSITAEMHSHSLPAACGLARSGQFDEVRRLLDVGGGSGCFCITLGMRLPHLTFGILDLPEVCQAARGYARTHGMQDRICSHGLDMFRDVWPSGYDAILLSNVLHDWERSTCLELLERAHAALPRGGRVYVHEMLLNDDGNGPATASAFSVYMAVRTRGQQFTFAQLSALLVAAGFREPRLTHTYAYYSLISATR